MKITRVGERGGDKSRVMVERTSRIVEQGHTLCPFRVDWHVPNPFSTPSFDPGIDDSTALFVADKSHTRSVLSREPETRLLPSGENATLFVSCSSYGTKRRWRTCRHYPCDPSTSPIVVRW